MGNREQVQEFAQSGDLIWLTFQQSHSGCCVERSAQGSKGVGAERLVQKLGK